MSVGQDVSIIHPLGRVDPNIYNVKYPQFPCRSMEMRNLFLPRSGGAGRDRTDDLKLAKLPLSQLSYSPLRTRVAVSSHPISAWWAWIDSNYRPHAYQACALTT